MTRLHKAITRLREHFDKDDQSYNDRMRHIFSKMIAESANDALEFATYCTVLDSRMRDVFIAMDEENRQ